VRERSVDLPKEMMIAMAKESKRPEVQVQIEQGEKPIAVSGRWEAGSVWDAYRLRLNTTTRLERLVVDVRHTEPISEILTPAPNLEDVRETHPSQTICLGYGLSHPDYRFGPQWMFTPPPLVLPMHGTHGWTGVAVAAEPGKNRFASVSYHWKSPGHYQLVIWYHGASVDAGEWISLWFMKVPVADPNAVVHQYAESLRDKGWAPRPRRDVAAWWAEPMVCTWGEQCNYYHHLNVPRAEEGQFAVTSYETQANQMRWLGQLRDRNIPFGVVSTSDKWQRRRYRLIPDQGRYQDFRGFAEWNHKQGRHVIAWWGLWNHDGAPLDWCITDKSGQPLTVDPTNPQYRKIVEEDIARLISPDGYDYDGFFLDFSAHQPQRSDQLYAGSQAGIEMLHDYLALIYQTAKSVKPDAMIMTHAPHPYFADVTDVLRLNDWSVRSPNVVEQARYRSGIARAGSDWLINTDNWMMYDLEQWRAYLEVQPELGIPATWFTEGVRGEGSQRFEAFTDEDYRRWKQIWEDYRRHQGLG